MTPTSHPYNAPTTLFTYLFLFPHAFLYSFFLTFVVLFFLSVFDNFLFCFPSFFLSVCLVESRRINQRLFSLQHFSVLKSTSRLRRLFSETDKLMLFNGLSLTDS